MDRHLRSGIIVFALFTLGAATHLLPHQMGVSTIGAVGMLAAAFLPRHLALVPVLATLLIGDAVSGFYGALAMSFVYLAHFAATVASMPILRRRGDQGDRTGGACQCRGFLPYLQPHTDGHGILPSNARRVGSLLRQCLALFGARHSGQSGVRRLCLRRHCHDRICACGSSRCYRAQLTLSPRWVRAISWSA